MNPWLSELLWGRECVSEMLGGIVVGLLISGGLFLGQISPFITHLAGAIVSVGVFSVLVGARLANSPEED